MNKTLLRELVSQYKLHADARDTIADILNSGVVNFVQYLPPSQKCTWTYHPERHGRCEYWETGCGHTFTLGDGTPADNDMKFCPYCGKQLVASE